MKYKSVIVTRRGGPEVLQIIENDLRAPSAGEICIKILAASVCLPDVQARYGQTPFAPKIPYVPGSAIIGVVDAIGKNVTKAAKGDRVAALTVNGGYAEYIFLGEERLIPVPANLDPAEAVTLILNYLVAYQTLFRLLGEGKIKPVIMKKYPILEAAKANELLESGKVTGNIVLMAPELL